ncbi:MAG: SLAP domain-containing protein, partial [Lactobacillus crispatus]|nr:SLAP domain-containing protein [Lactobacillus crispatus]
KDTAETINRIKHPSYVYDKNGQPIPGKFVKQGSKVKNLGHKEIDERPFIQIGENEYVKANNVLTVIINY